MAEEEKTEEKKEEEKKEEEKKQKKKKERTGKKPHKNKKPSQRWKKYSIEGETIKREKNCPRCGPGIFLMKAKKRLYCGKCHYTEFTTKTEQEAKKVEENKETDSKEK